MSQQIALQVRTPQPDLAAITNAAQRAQLNDYQLRNAPMKSELEGLQLQDQIGGEKAMAGYRDAVGRGDPNAIKQLDGQPEMQAKMYKAFDGMSPQEFMQAAKRSTAFKNAAQHVLSLPKGSAAQEQAWNASIHVLKEAKYIDDRQFRMMQEAGPSDLIIQQALTADQWVQQYLAQTGKNKEPFTLGEGQVRYDASGNQIAAGPPKSAGENKFGIVGEDQFGNKQYGYPPPPPDPENANASSAVPIPQANAAEGPDAGIMDLHGEEFLAQLDPKIGSQVKAIIEGRAPYPTGMMLRTPYGQRLATYVTQADPTFEAANANARAKVQADYSTGTIAKTNNALNTSIEHMLQLSDTVDALKNYGQEDGYGPLNNTLNSAKNSYLTHSGDPRVTNFKSVSGKVAEELTRAYRGAGGAEADISREIEILNSSNSPEQLHSAIAKMADLLKSKIEANEEQYSQVMGPLVKPRPMISDKARQALDEIAKRVAPSADGSAPAEMPEWVKPYEQQGAKLAPDGNWYVPDEQRPGKYLQIQPDNAQ